MAIANQKALSRVHLTRHSRNPLQKGLRNSIMQKPSLNKICFLSLVLFYCLITVLATRAFAAGEQAPSTVRKPAAETAKKSDAKEIPATGVKPEQEKANQRILDNIRASFSVPPTIEMNVVSRGPSKISGLETVTIEVKDGVNSNRQEVLVTNDNKYALIARVFDLTEDPYAENIKKMNLSNSPVFGSKEAKVTIVEYSDFQCPFCSQAYRTIENDVLKQYGDKVKVVFKNFPLPSHPWAENAAIASLCAYSQSNDAFWSFYRSFFENQSSITVDNVKSKAMEFAGNVKIDTKKFESCYDGKTTLPQVKADMAEAQLLGITGTPLFIVNGHPLPGVQPFASFQKVIEEELKKTAK